MIIPDMLKNAPMFKRLDAKIKVQFFRDTFVLKGSEVQHGYMLNSS